MQLAVLVESASCSSPCRERVVQVSVCRRSCRERFVQLSVWSLDESACAERTAEALRAAPRGLVQSPPCVPRVLSSTSEVTVHV